MLGLVGSHTHTLGWQISCQRAALAAVYVVKPLAIKPESGKRFSDRYTNTGFQGARGGAQS